MSFLPLYLEMVGIKFVNDLHITLNLKSRGSKALLTMFKKSSVLVERASLREMSRTFYLQQVGQAVLETSLPEPSLLCDPNMGLPHFFGSTKKDGWLESILISLVRQISYVWGWNCPEGSAMTSRSPSLKRLNLESTSVSLGV